MQKIKISNIMMSQLCTKGYKFREAEVIEGLDPDLLLVDARVRNGSLELFFDAEEIKDVDFTIKEIK